MGCHRRGPQRFGFLLEYDRRTERSRPYAAQLATYHLYRESGDCRRDCGTFPTLIAQNTYTAH